MMIKKRNILDIRDVVSKKEEIFEEILRNEEVLFERIISSGQTTPEGEWFDQEKDEWVMLLQGKASLEFEHGERYNLNPGDYLLIPAHQRHRVTFTTKKQECIWLAIHGNLS